jgi:CHAT domain-containing protein
MSRALGAGDDTLFLRERATESRLKALDLSKFKIVAFATHAMVAGDMPALAEPALVMTPPTTASAEDDGLLTASEVAGLALNADLVILSACSTAAPDGTPGAEGLSGLAKAFIYAGSRALLVSHWPVISDAAVRLTTGMVTALEAEPGIGRAEALRRSMLGLIDADPPYFAHPAFWAPFTVVGEGGSASRS